MSNFPVVRHHNTLWCSVIWCASMLLFSLQTYWLYYFFYGPFLCVVLFNYCINLTHELSWITLLAMPPYLLSYFSLPSKFRSETNVLICKCIFTQVMARSTQVVNLLSLSYKWMINSTPSLLANNYTFHFDTIYCLILTPCYRKYVRKKRTGLLESSNRVVFEYLFYIISLVHILRY